MQIFDPFLEPRAEKSIFSVQPVEHTPTYSGEEHAQVFGYYASDDELVVDEEFDDVAFVEWSTRNQDAE